MSYSQEVPGIHQSSHLCNTLSLNSSDPFDEILMPFRSIISDISLKISFKHLQI